MTQNSRPLLLQPASDYFLRVLARDAGLEESFQAFMDAAAPPENMQALLFAADRFRSVLTDPKLPSHWNQMQPFLGWVDLFNLFLSNADKITAHYRGAPALGTNIMPAQRSLLYKLMELYPHFAMTCTVHQNPADDLLYAGLQLQCLRAHWKKVDAFRRNNPGREGMLREFRKDKDSKASSDRDIKLSHQACRAVRAMQLDRRRNLLISIAPLQTPGQFLDILQTPPPGDESRRLCIKLRRYCEAGYEPGSGGGGGERIRGGRTFPIPGRLSGPQLRADVAWRRIGVRS